MIAFLLSARKVGFFFYKHQYTCALLPKYFQVAEEKQFFVLQRVFFFCCCNSHMRGGFENSQLPYAASWDTPANFALKPLSAIVSRMPVKYSALPFDFTLSLLCFWKKILISKILWWFFIFNFWFLLLFFILLFFGDGN